MRSCLFGLSRHISNSMLFVNNSNIYDAYILECEKEKTWISKGVVEANLVNTRIYFTLIVLTFTFVVFSIIDLLGCQIVKTFYSWRPVCRKHLLSNLSLKNASFMGSLYMRMQDIPPAGCEATSFHGRVCTFHD